MRKILAITVLAGFLLTVPSASPDAAAGCCIHRGDVDYSGGPNPIDISDIVYLVNYIFMGGPEPPCPEQADVKL